MYYHIGENLPALDVPVSHFTSVDGRPEDQAKTLAWHALLVEAHVEILKSLVPEGDLLALLDWLQNQSVSQKIETYNEPLFCLWLSRQLMAFDNQASSDRIHELPLLLLTLLPRLPGDFQTQIWLGSTADPIGCGWGLRCEPGYYELLLDHDRSTIFLHKDDELIATIPFAALGHTCKSDSIEVNRARGVSAYDRYFAAERIEITDYERYPYVGLKTSEHLNFAVTEGEIIQHVDNSLTYLAQAWPGAWEGLKAYGRLLAVGSPKNLDSNNSCSTKIYPFVQAVEVPFWSPAKNTESFVHEMSHCKYHLLAASTQLYHNREDDFSFRHPWMTIPRPLRGVLLGGHAFLNILEYYIRVAQEVPEAEAFCQQQIALRWDEVEQVLFTELPKGRYTPTGEEFVTLMQERFQELSTLSS